MSTQPIDSRRHFLHFSAAAATGLLVARCAPAADPPATAPGQQEQQISPNEDLMREHGVLKRVILAYDEILRRLQANQDFPPDSLAQAAGIIRNFIENYHEKLEEDYLFPRFEKANQLVDLVKTLRTQHDAGRRVTDIILARANAQALRNPDDRAKLADAIHQFNRMYAPHEAREDTVLFPAFHQIVSPHEFDALGEEFEKKERQFFGQDGFEKAVDQVAAIEKTLGIYDLAQFTPKL